MKSLIPILLITLSAGVASAGGIQGPDGTWYCDNGYVATAKGCVAAPKSHSDRSSANPSRPRVEYSDSEPANDGSRNGSREAQDAAENISHICARYKGSYAQYNDCLKSEVQGYKELHGK